MTKSGTFRAIATIGGLVAQALIGAFFIALGAYVAFTALQHEPHDNKLIWTGIATAIFGALIFPSIFPIFQKVYVLVLPNGIPLPSFLKGKPPDPAPTAVVTATCPKCGKLNAFCLCADDDPPPVAS